MEQFSHLFCFLTDGIFNICIIIFLWHLSWYVYTVRTIYSVLLYNCIVCILYNIMYYIRGLDLCAAIVQFYCTYSLYYLVLHVSSEFCSVYLYYLLLKHRYSAPLQNQRNWCQPPLPTARRPSRANGGAPVPAPANIGPSIPPPSHPRPIHSIRPI